MDLTDYVRSKLKQFQNTVAQGAGNIGNFIVHEAQQLPMQIQHSSPVQYFNSTSNNGNNFWSSPAASVLAGHTQLPQFNFEPLANNIQNPVLKFGAQTGLGAVSSLANTPRNLVQAPINVARDVNTGVQRPQQYLSDVAPFAEGMLNIGTLGGGTVAKGIAGQGLKEGVFQGVKQGAIQGAKYGALYGGVQGLQTGANLNAPQYASNLALNTGAGALGGSILGGVTGAIAGLPRSVVANTIERLFPKATTNEIQQKTDQYLERTFTRNGAGQFAKAEPYQFIPAGRTYAVQREPLKVNHWMDQVDQEIKNNIPQPGLSIKPVDSSKLLNKKTIGEMQIATQDPELTKYENAFNSGDKKTLDRLAAKHPGDTRFMVHKSFTDRFLAEPPAPARMSQQAIREGITTPRTGSDISVSPLAVQRFKQPTAREQASIQDFEKNVIGSPLETTQRFKPLRVQTPDNLPQFSTEDMDRAAFRADYNSMENKKAFDGLFAQWMGRREAARTQATQLGYKYKSIPEEEGMTTIKALEDPTIKTTPVVKQNVDALHNEFESLYKDAVKDGIDIGHRENYITHFWGKDENAVKQEYQVFKQKEFIQNDRQVPTYEEGISMGLKPKYTHPAPILADYAQRLEKLKANLDFIKKAKHEGFIVDASVGMKQPGFVPITAPGFPRSVSRGIDNRVVSGAFYAPEPVANQINRIFASPDSSGLGKTFRAAGKVSGTLQDIGLSGGVPFTPLNAFTFAQAQKELLAGRIISPVTSLFRSMHPEAARQYFNRNAETIKQMQLRNIPLHSSYNIEDVLGKEQPEGLKGWTQEIWHKAMNDPTFSRFMPMLQINLFNDIQRQALSKGITSEEAADIAANAVKSFYGVTGNNVTATRSELGRNLSKTFLFAPQYRESMINFWINNLKSLKDPLAIENQTNVRFLVGSLLTLGTMNYLNEKFNGHGMAQNPSGKEDKLLIPLKDGNVIGIPFLSSIATVPRGIVREGLMASKGDLSGAALDAASTFSSMAVKPAFDVLKNSDYYGKPIVSEGDTTTDKFKKQAGYLASQYLTHPYLKELTNPQNQNDPLYQRLSRSAELPLRFYTQKSIDSAPYFQKLADVNGLSQAQQKQWGYITTSVKSGGADSTSKAQILLNDPQLLTKYRDLQLASDSNNPLYNLPEDRLKQYFAYELAQSQGLTSQAAQIRMIAPWIPSIQAAYSDFMAQKTKTKAYDHSPLQQLTPEQVRAASAYTAANAQGNIAVKRTILAANPWLKSYWDANTQYYQQHPSSVGGVLGSYLQSLGIDPSTQQSSSYAYSGVKRLRARFRTLRGWKKAKKPKIKHLSVKVKSLKVATNSHKSHLVG